MSCIPATSAAEAVVSSCTGPPKTMLCYIPAASSPDTSGSYSNHEFELLQDAQNSTAELERFYVSSSPLLGSNGGSLLQSIQTADQPMQQQEEQKVGGGKKSSINGEVIGEFKRVSSLRSPIAGDLPSPQQMGSMQPLTVKLLHGFNHPHTPTQSSSAAVEDTSLSPSTPHSIFPRQCANILDSSTTSLLPHSLTELVSPTSLSPSNGNDNADSPHQPLMCLWDKCQLEFCSLSSLVTHLDRTHTLAMTQFICLWENCSRQLKPFDARYKLITHLRCHTGEKPYQCDVVSCKRSFSRLENLKLHMRTHTGEKPYQCDFASCLKKFNNTSDRAKHKKTHITRKPYACKYPGCGKSYTDPSSMRKHIKYAHRQKEVELGRDHFPLSTLPKRKRNSASSSSSSSSSSTSHTPHQSSAVIPHATMLGVQEPTGSPPMYGIAGSPGCSQPQLIPMVKIGGKVQGSQPVLVPAMMIVANSSKPANWVTVPSSTQHPLPASNGTVLNSTLPDKLGKVGYAGQGKAIDVRGELPHSQAKYQTSSSSSNVEDQLRLQIVHLQQQLYQSQLAAARATQRPQIVAVSQGNDHTHLTQHVVGKGPLHSVTMAKHFLPGSTNGTEQSSLAMVTGVKSVSMTTPHPRVADVPMGQPILVSNTTAAADVGTTLPNTTVLPQYIPIVHPQEVTGAQYLYMSP